MARRSDLGFLRHEPDAVVDDLHRGAAVSSVQRHADVLRLRVLPRVREGLLGDPIEDERCLYGRLLVQVVVVDHPVERRVRVVEQVGERRHEPFLLQRGRAEIEQQRAHALDRHAHDLERLVDVGQARVLPAEDLEPHLQRGHLLHRIVVDVVSDPGALLLGSLDDVLQQPAPLLVDLLEVRDDLPKLLGARRDLPLEFLVVRSELLLETLDGSQL